VKVSGGLYQDQEKILYISSMEKVEKLDEVTKANLKYLMECGFLNFEVNLGLLKKYENDLAVVMNMICNNMVTDSIFLAK
jgi:hypothetical protein